MTDALLRLTWALPLVLAVGGLAVLILRRFLVPMANARAATPRLALRESLTLSDATRVHMIDVEGTSYLVVESTRLTSAQPTQKPTVRRWPR